MRYLTHYEEYPIYEPAEGGYYYAGNYVVETERLSKRQAKKKLKALFKELEKESELLASTASEWGCRPDYAWAMHPDGNKVEKYHKYIGAGESYVIERNYGSERKGRVPYC